MQKKKMEQGARITQQDIADSLNISRLTVSKALNNGKGVSPETHNRVLQKAREIGYTRLSLSDLEVLGEVENGRVERLTEKPSGGQIYLLSNLRCTTDSYWAPVISGIVELLDRYDYSLTLCFVSLFDRDDFDFPGSFDMNAARGIIQLGNFTRRHTQKIRQCGVPLVSIDTSADFDEDEMLCDVIMSINTQPMMQLIDHLITRGHKRLGYVGSTDTQLTFKERWDGFCAAMKDAGLPIDPRNCFLSEADQAVRRILQDGRLDDLSTFPTALVCANDMTAISMMNLLKEHGVMVPDQVAVCGFDNLSESAMAELTTANVNKMELGIRAAEEIIWRIQNPDRPYEMIRIMKSEPILRHSTDRVL